MTDSTDSGLQELKRQLFSKDWRVLFPAAAALSRQPGGAPAPEKFDVLSAAVLTGQVSLVEEVLEPIASHGREVATPVLLQLSRDFPGKRAIFDVLAQVDPERAVARLVEMSDAQLNAISRSVEKGPLADALVRSESVSVVRRLIDWLRANSVAATMLKRMDERLVGPELLDSFLARGPVFQHDMELFADVLGDLAIPALLSALSDPLRVVRERAATALIRLGTRALAPVLEWVEQGHGSGLEAALRVVRTVGDRSAEPLMRRLLADPASPSRPQLAEALAQLLGGEAEDAIVPLTRSPLRALRTSSTAALRHVPTHGSVSELVALVRSAGSDVRRPALGSLTWLTQQAHAPRIGSAEALASLYPELGENERSQVEYVLLRLAETRAPEILAAIEASLAAIDTESDAAGAARSAITQLRDKFEIEARQGEQERARVAALEREGLQVMRQQSQAATGPFDPFADRRLPHAPGATLRSPGSQPPWVANAPTLDTDCYFSVIAPESVKHTDPFIVEVWCDTEDPSEHHSERRTKSDQIRVRGPIPVASGSTLTVNVSIPGFTVADNDSALLWRARTGVVGFEVTPIDAVTAGAHSGVARISLSGIVIASVRFIVEVGACIGRTSDRTSSVRKIDSAFASYASEDRESVLSRIQGMQKILPSLDVFLDVLTLRAGEVWRERIDEEIAQRDALFLFWSRAASQSKWVDYEWRKALDLRGMEFLEPVPLEPPSLAPVPAELAHLHFNDWTLNVGR